MDGLVRATAETTAHCSDYPAYPHKLALICGACGHEGKYDVGTIFHNVKSEQSDEERPVEDFYAFSGHFRCMKCASSDLRHFPNRTKEVLTKEGLKLIPDEGRHASPGFFIGMPVLFDGTPAITAAWAEDYLRELIAQEPDDFFLYGRLANVLCGAELYDEARVALNRAVELNPGDISSLHELAVLDLEEDLVDSAITRFQQVLQHSRQATFLTEEVRLEIVSDTLGYLVELDALEQSLEHVALEDQKGEFAPDEFDAVTEEDWARVIDQFLPEMLNTLLPPPELLSAMVPEVPEDEFEDPYNRRPLVRTEERVSRNAPCPCGSGNKFKRCCGRS
ncbi:SEC-C metal-binding domain-containing protein [Planctomicrobium piriforme]|uniref:SEC-C motif-containing protein n=1 Tax=Planctomicrobium piriforme TaxID=1576369 RepID=A0A1I3RPG3_9PLAN|nr:SEC-C metal-binding domain-containing protein [Planctomicrobium piriforme]SFJ47161.1 SEC-C motif-containing protein [Planctomicrobium piriforme]